MTRFNPNAPFRQVNRRPAELVEVFRTGRLLVKRWLADGSFEFSIYQPDGRYFTDRHTASKWDLVNTGDSHAVA